MPGSPEPAGRGDSRRLAAAVVPPGPARAWTSCPAADPGGCRPPAAEAAPADAGVRRRGGDPQVHLRGHPRRRPRHRAAGRRQAHPGSTDVDWHDPERFTRKKRKEAVLTGETLARRMRGTWELTDNATGRCPEAQAGRGPRPYLSSMGTFTHRGNEYTVNHQQRLLPGVFARVKDNGELESHFNVLPGKGVSATATSSTRRRGVQDPHRPGRDAPDAAAAGDGGHRQGDPRRLGRRPVAGQLRQERRLGVRKLASGCCARPTSRAPTRAPPPTARRRVPRMELDPEVTGGPWATRTPTSPRRPSWRPPKKLLAVSRKEADPDDRDHLAYQSSTAPRTCSPSASAATTAASAAAVQEDQPGRVARQDARPGP
jgi:hypothetical protein